MRKHPYWLLDVLLFGFLGVVILGFFLDWFI